MISDVRYFFTDMETYCIEPELAIVLHSFLAVALRNVTEFLL